MTNVTEFLRESRRIDQLIWDAMALVADERALFCSYANDGEWVRRAIEVGVAVTVIDSDPRRLSELEQHGIKTLRGSTTLIPARDQSFDAVVAFHYLHEIDPTFHAQTMFELARVGKRIVVVEPAPPTDLLGKRIAELYSRAKFEAGAFEEYKPIDYWRKLLAIVKADVLMQQFTFGRVAPRFLINDTVDLLLDAMAISDMPQSYLDELRSLARQTDTQLAPLSRYVLVAVPGGTEPRRSAGTLFRPDDVFAQPVPLPKVAAPPPPAPVAAAVAPLAPAEYLEQSEFPPVLGPDGQTVAPGTPPPATQVPIAAAATPAPAVPAPAAPPPAPEAPAAAPPEEPQTAAPAPAAAAKPAAVTPLAPPAAKPSPAKPAPAKKPRPKEESPFGLPGKAGGAAPAGAPFGTPFALPDDPDPFGLEEDPSLRPGTGWSWEPPEDEEPYGTEEDYGDLGDFGLPKGR